MNLYSRLSALTGPHAKTLSYALKFLLPPALGLAYIGMLYLYDTDVTLRLISLLTAYVFPPFGKESVIPIGISVGVGPSLMVSSLVVTDFLLSLFIIWNFSHLLRLPVIGWALRRTEAKGRAFLLKRASTRRLSFLGLAIFMTIPFQGTGAITTTLIGRIVGMDRRRVLAIVLIGSMLGAIAIAYGFVSLLSLF